MTRAALGRRAAARGLRGTASRPGTAARGLGVAACGLAAAVTAGTAQPTASGGARSVTAVDRPATYESRPVPARRSGTRSADNVVLITIDGLRWQEVFAGADERLMAGLEAEAAARVREEYWRATPAERREALLPFTWSVLAERGQLFGNAWLESEVIVENGRLFSYPGYNEMLAGFPDPRIDSNAKRPNPNLTVLEWLNRRPGFEGRVAAFCSWDVFPYILNEERSGVYVNAGWEDAGDEPLTERQALLDRLSRDTPWIWDDVRYDAFTFYAALEHLRQHEPRVLFIGLDATDSRAHEGRYDLYLAAARRFDRLLAHLWETLQSMDAYRDKTAVIITTDHGRGEGPEAWRSHGARVDGAERIWIGLLGREVEARGERSDTPRLVQGQVAATLAALVGEDYAAAVPGAAPPVETVSGSPVGPSESVGGVRFEAVAGLGIPPLQEAAPDSIVGIWEGALQIPGGGELTIVFHIDRAEDGTYTATMDSPDQGAEGIPVSEVSYADGDLRLVSAAVNGEYEATLSSDGSRLEGEWRQSGTSLPLTVERVEEATRHARPQEPEPPLPYRAEEVRFANREAEVELAGTLTLPEGPRPFPAAVLISGSGPQDRDETVFGHRPFLVLADHLTRHGIAVLRYDDRGFGESEGDFATATSEDFAGDARAAVDYLKARDAIDPSRIGLIGHSEGGIVAPMVAAESEEVAFVVLLAGTGLTGEEILYRQGALIGRAAGRPEAAVERNVELQRDLFEVVKRESDREKTADRLRELFRDAIAQMSEAERQAAGLAGENVDRVIETQIRQLTSPWFRFFLTYDPLSTLERVDVPVLAINGELDLQVPSDANLEAIEAALERGGNPDYTVRELPGLNHLFQEAETGSPSEYAGIEQTMSPAALDLITAWILARVGG